MRNVARLWFRPGDLNDLWAGILLGAGRAQPLGAFTEKAIAELHGKILRYGRARMGVPSSSGEEQVKGFEVPVYPGERKLIARLGAMQSGDIAEDADMLVALLEASPTLLALSPDLEGRILSSQATSPAICKPS